MLFGSTSVIETPLGNVIAFVDVFTENKVRSSEPSNSFMAIVFVAELSSQIVPATADAGLDPPRIFQLTGYLKCSQMPQSRSRPQ